MIKVERGCDANITRILSSVNSWKNKKVNIIGKKFSSNEKLKFSMMFDVQKYATILSYKDITNV